MGDKYESLGYSRPMTDSELEELLSGILEADKEGGE